MIIHISGPSGSGKTTLGNKLKEKFKNKIVVKDLDDLLFEFVMIKEKSKYPVSTILKNWKEDYQKYIDKYIKNQNKPIIFVGLNIDMNRIIGFRKKELKPPKAFYNIHADYKFYIDLPIEQILQQKFFRQTQKICDNKEKMFEKWLINPNRVNYQLEYLINISLWNKETEKWNKLYKKKNYNFMDKENIYNNIVKLLSSKK